MKAGMIWWPPKELLGKKKIPQALGSQRKSIPFFNKLCLAMLLLAVRGAEAQLLLIAVISNNPPDICRGQCF